MAIILALLFLLAFTTGRRFALLGLGVAAGTLLANQAAPWLEEVFVSIEPYLGGISPTQATTILLVLLPSLVLLLTGPKYGSKKSRFVSALLYTVMAGFAILPFVLSDVDLPTNIKSVIVNFQTSAIALGIVLALLDNILSMRRR